MLCPPSKQIQNQNFSLITPTYNMSKKVGGFAFSSGAAPARRADAASSSSTSASASMKSTATSAGTSSSESARAEKRIRLEDGFVSTVDLSACWPRKGASDHARLSRFLDEAGKAHTTYVRDSLGASYPFLEGAVTSLYNGFLASCKQYVADDAKNADQQFAPNPRNTENEAKEAEALKQLEKYKEELRQWDQLSKAYAGSGGDGGGGGSSTAANDENTTNTNDDDDEADGVELDAETLKRFALSQDLDTKITTAVTSAVSKADKVTKAVRVVKRKLQTIHAGTAAVSSKTRQETFADLPNAKTLLKALVAPVAVPTGAGGGRNTTSSTLSSTISKSKPTTTTTTTTTGIESPPPSVLAKITQSKSTVSRG